MNIAIPFVLLVITQISLCLNNGIENDNKDCPESPHPPKIEFEENGDKFLQGNGTRLGSNTPLKLRCKAAYPVYWDFIPPLYASYHMKHEVIGEDVGSYCYTETLVLGGDSEAGYGRSANYTCRSALKWETSESLYLHIRDNYRLFDKVYNTTFSQLVNGDEWNIPCRGNVKKFDNISLWKLNESDLRNDIVEVPLDPSIRYDSKYWFLMNKSYHERPMGTFKCTGTFLGTEYNLELKLRNFNVEPPGNFVRYTETNSMVVMCEYDEKIRLQLSSPNNLTILNSTEGGGSFKYSLYVVYKGGFIDGSLTNLGEISCVTEKSKKVVHLWKYDLRKTCNCSTLADESSLKTSVLSGRKTQADRIKCHSPYHHNPPHIRYNSCEEPGKFSFVPRYFDLLNPSEVASYSPLHHRFNVQSSTFMVYMRYTASIVMCTIDEYTSITRATATLNGFEMNLLFGQFHLSRNLQLHPATAYKNLFPGDVVEYFCAASRSAFSNPLKWTFQNDAGTIMRKQYNVLQEMTNDWALISKISFTIDATLRNISCSAPMWNSTEWKMVTVTLPLTRLHQQTTSQRNTNALDTTTTQSRLNAYDSEFVPPDIHDYHGHFDHELEHSPLSSHENETTLLPNKFQSSSNTLNPTHNNERLLPTILLTIFLIICGLTVLIGVVKLLRRKRTAMQPQPPVCPDRTHLYSEMQELDDEQAELVYRNA